MLRPAPPRRVECRLACYELAGCVPIRASGGNEVCATSDFGLESVKLSRPDALTCGSRDRTFAAPHFVLVRAGCHVTSPFA
jgi:hypothetical protein